MRLTFRMFIPISILLISCSKPARRDIEESVSITSITPSSGSANTIVVIKGANFSPDATEDVVRFNNDQATVLSAREDSLVVSAPVNGTSGPVTVTVNGFTATGPDFTYIIDSVDVYIAGSANGVLYWKNGEEVFLESTQTNIGGAYGLAISDTDVYIAGYTTGPYIYNAGIAALWKNGKKTVLSEPDSIASVRALAVLGNDFYVGGNDNRSPVYWKNGIKTTLPVIPLGNGRVNALAINGSDVYAAGLEVGFNNNEYSVYWKNGIKTTLGWQTPIDIGATSIAISGSDVYVCGVDSGDAVYWKNGIRVVLAESAPQSVNQANAIAVSGNSVYVAGMNSNGAVYWKDGVETKLPWHSPSGARATAITVYKSDIYVGGSDGGPVYWKNGVEKALCCHLYGWVNQIAVVKH